MNKSAEFFKNRNIENTMRLRKIREELPAFCDEFFVGVESRTSALTRLNYGYDLRVFFHYLTTEIPTFSDIKPVDFTINHLKKVTLSHLERFVDYLSLYTVGGKTFTNENKGKSRKLSTVRSMFKYFYNKGYLDENVSAKLVMPKLYTKEIIRLEGDEIGKIIDAAESGDGLTKHQEFYHSKTALRDTALITLFLGTGIRISECVGLNVKDIDFQNNAFTVTRKGGNRTILYFSDEVATALTAYLRERELDDSVPDDEPALFLSMQNRRISVRAVQDLVKKYARIASPLKKISPHKLRSTYGTALYRETGDIFVVAEVLGHRDVNTTKKHYAAMSEDIKRKASTAVNLRKKDD